MKRLLMVGIVIVALGVVGCAGKDIKSFEGAEPKFRPEQFFDGHVRAWGYSENRFGSINQWFEADFHGETNGDTLTMHEELRYSDGRVIERDWTVVKQSDHEYTVRATDMVGEGKALAYGNAVQWKYYLNVSIGGSKWTLWFDDWMFKRDDNTMIDRATISKYGLTLGRANIYFRKLE